MVTESCYHGCCMRYCLKVLPLLCISVSVHEHQKFWISWEEFSWATTNSQGEYEIICFQKGLVLQSSDDCKVVMWWYILRCMLWNIWDQWYYEFTTQVTSGNVKYFSEGDTMRNRIWSVDWGGGWWKCTTSKGQRYLNGISDEICPSFPYRRLIRYWLYALHFLEVRP